MLAQEVIDLARKPLNDDSKVRYTDETLLAYLNQGVQQLRKQRPDLFMGFLNGYIADISVNDTIPVAPTQRQKLADYVTGRAETVNADIGEASRAAAFLQLSGIK